MATTIIFLTSGTSWTVPGDFNPASNTIEAIGGAGNGCNVSGVYGAGGNGAGYAKITNFNPGVATSISYQIGIRNGTVGAGTSPTGNSWFKDASTLVAAGGETPTTATAAANNTLANSVGTIKYGGGSGANGTGAGQPTGAGGGAGGPNGAGGNASTTTGGSADGGTIAGGAPNAAGNNGTEWDATHGSGSGGGGRTSNAPGMAGGLYGGGGGGNAGIQNQGFGGGGIIVITYQPLYTTIFLTSGTSFALPADWNPAHNTIEAIGAGLNGAAGGASSGTPGGAGGAGGNYAKITNFSGAGPVPYQIGAANGTTGPGTAPTANSWFNNASTLVAPGGDSTTTNAVGTTAFAGGAPGAAVSGGGSGGGAGGPNGAGNPGTAAASFAGGDGGAGDAGSGGPGGLHVVNNVGNSGGNGTEWDASHGSGGGGAGGGGATTVNAWAGGAAGQYGAGGGGGGGTQAGHTPGAGGLGKGGLIVITYWPAVAATPTLAQAFGDVLPRTLPMPVMLRVAFAEWLSVATLPTPTPTPTTQFSAVDDTLPSRAIAASQLLARMATTGSQVTIGLVPPPYVPPTIPGRVTIPYFQFVPLDELAMWESTLVIYLNQNFLGLGLDPHQLMPGVCFVSADDLVLSLNNLIEGANARFNQLGLPVRFNVPYFVGLEPSEATLAFYTLAEEFNGVFFRMYGV